MVPRHVAICAVLLGFGLASQAPVSAQSTQPPRNTNITNMPNIIIPPDLLPDLVISAASVKATCVDKKTVTADISATVKNMGPKATADLTKVTWQIVIGARWGSTSGPGNLENPNAVVVNPQVGGPKTLPPGGTWTGKLTFVGIPRFKKSFPKQGEYAFGVDADPNNGIGESNEKNNEKLIYALDPCYKL
ncbi:MAG: hypothetical protein R3D05_12830 [Dongiaceae bacterium]